MAEAKTLSTGELQALLNQNTNVEFWNVLTDEYFSGEMIPGSRRVPLDRVGREVSGRRMPKDAEIVVYCRGVSCPQSRQAAEKLSALGYASILVYEGGLEAWKDAGLPLQTLEAGARAP